MISIIVPIYNAEKFVCELIKQLKTQTFQDYEVILVDNNSKDNTFALLKDACEEDQRFHVLKEMKQGPNYARFCGYQHAKGEYLYFFDCDDTLYENTLEVLMQSAMDNKSDIVIGDYVELDERNVQQKYCEGINYKVESTSNIYDKEYIFFIKPPLWNKLFKKSIINATFFIYTNIGEDMALVLSSIANANRISYVSCPVYKYKVSNTGLSYQITLKNTIGIIDTISGLDEIFSKMFQDNYKEQIRFVEIQHYLFRLLRSVLLNKEQKKQARRMLLPYIKAMDISSNKYFRRSIPFRLAYLLLCNRFFFTISQPFLKFMLTNNTLNELFKKLDR